MPETIIQTTINPSFTSESNGKHYDFVAVFSGIDESSTDFSTTNLLLNSTFIKSFTWVNEINNILLTGELEYIDTTGEISKFFGSYLAYVYVSLSRNTSKDETVDNSVKQEFNHLFLVNNYEILSRSGSNVIYRLYLVSAHWFNYIANIEYSTHSSDDSKPNEKDIFQIIQDVLKIAFKDNAYITCDDESFKAESGVQLEYCTTIQSKLDSIIKYLQNKMIYHQDRVDNISFLVLDEFSKKIKLLSLGNDANTKIITSDKIGTVIGVFGSDVEAELQYTEQNLKSVIKKSNCQGMGGFLNTTLWNYDSTSNVLSSHTIGIDELINIGVTNNFVSDTDETYVPIYKSDMFLNKAADVFGELNYSRVGTTDNNNFSIYNDLVENIINRNSLILETAGEISHQPGQIFSIVDDSEIIKAISDIKNENVKDKFRMFTGLFYIFKVRHVVIPGDSGGYSFYERLFISRTHNKKLELTKTAQNDQQQNEVPHNARAHAMGIGL